jgi:CRP/FNR family transcriptional regulator, cyclic AMP receptor protein
VREIVKTGIDLKCPFSIGPNRINSKSAGGRRADPLGSGVIPSQGGMVNPILELCKSVPVRAFEPGAPLLAEGKKSGLLYVLIDGEVEIVKGDFQINVVSDTGAIFGEISALLNLPHMATVRALSECRAHEVRNGDEFLKAHPEIAHHLAQLLARRLHGVSTYLVDLKQQFSSHENHLGMVDDVLESLVNQQHQRFVPGSDRDPG